MAIKTTLNKLHQILINAPGCYRHYSNPMDMLYSFECETYSCGVCAAVQHWDYKKRSTCTCVGIMCNCEHKYCCTQR